MSEKWYIVEVWRKVEKDCDTAAYLAIVPVELMKITEGAANGEIKKSVRWRGIRIF